MRKKQILKMIIDILMTITLLMLMGFQITGQLIHEWLGIGMFALWIFHHFLNRKWSTSIFKGRYTPYRIIQTAVNILLVFCMIGLMYSGMILSRYALSFLNMSTGVALARKIHLIASNWSFILMSVHIGMHWNSVISAVQRNKKLKYLKLIRILAVAFVVYGVNRFVNYRIADNLFLLSEFAYFDYEQTSLGFFVGYAAIMGLFVFAAHELMKVMRHKKVNFAEGDDK